MVLIECIDGRQALLDDSGRPRLLTPETWHALVTILAMTAYKAGQVVHAVPEEIFNELLKGTQTRMGASYG